MKIHSICLVLTFLTCVKASAWASSGQGGSFLLAMDLSIPPFEFAEIRNQIKDHSRLNQAYLSLGESHWEELSTHPLQKAFASAYLDDQNLPPVKLCSEKIASFLESEEGLWLKQNVQSTEVYLANSPAVTDFENCPSTGFKRSITYSGFFHQNRFAFAFPAVFPPTSVITQAGNNIRDQMENRNGFFISQLEFPVLELFEIPRVLKLANQGLNRFQTEASLLIQKGDALRSMMKTVLQNESPYLRKRGVFIDQRHFEGSGASVFSDSKSYLFITDLEFRRNRKSYYFLNTLLKLPSSDLNHLLQILVRSKYYFLQTDLVPFPDGTPMSMTFGRVPKSFNGEATQIAFLKNGREALVVAMSADDEELSCFNIPTDPSEVVMQSNCAQALEQF
ncbi:MAG: hypothetical protein H7333_05040 [Bdellovibrionales bacterium]|nr:hypothetical protein [Oligoflexia bacterium]